ncbi:MAG: hypothetical protein U0003_03225 [Vampirovibrionales bacterium]
MHVPPVNFVSAMRVRPAFGATLACQWKLSGNTSLEALSKNREVLDQINHFLPSDLKSSKDLQLNPQTGNLVTNGQFRPIVKDAKMVPLYISVTMDPQDPTQWKSLAVSTNRDQWKNAEGFVGE